MYYIKIIATVLLVGVTTVQANERTSFRTFTNKLCRNPSGVEAKGKNIDKYNNINRDGCKRKCKVINQDNNDNICYGFQYSSNGNCIVWKTEIGKGEDMVVAEDNTDCYKAVGQIVVQNNIDLDIPVQKEGVVVDVFVPDIETIDYEGFSCRTKGGGRGVRGQDYESFKRTTEQECEDRCAIREENCNGFEYTKGRRGQCKIWKKSIGSLKDINGVMCRVKENGKGFGKLPQLIPNSSGTNAINGNKVTGIVDSNDDEWTKVDSGKWKQRIEGTDVVKKWKELKKNINSIILVSDGQGTEIFQFDVVSMKVNLCNGQEDCEQTATIKSVSTSAKASNNCSSNKQITIYKTYISKEVGEDGATGKSPNRITYGGKVYFPNENTKKKDKNCKQDPKGYCKWSDNTSHFIEEPPKITTGKVDDKVQRITIGNIEKLDENQIITNAQLNAEDWHVDTCETYEVIVVAKLNTQGRTKNLCFDARVKDVEDNEDAVVCRDETEEDIIRMADEKMDGSDHIIWWIEVKPAVEESSQRAFRLFSSP